MTNEFMRKLSQLAISSEGFVFNPSTGDSFQASQTGLVIIHALREGRSDDEIVRKLNETHEVSIENARRDLADFRGSLKSLGLI